MSFPTPTKYKKDFPFLKEVDSIALANAQLNLDEGQLKEHSINKIHCKLITLR